VQAGPAPVRIERLSPAPIAPVSGRVASMPRHSSPRRRCLCSRGGRCPRPSLRRCREGIRGDQKLSQQVIALALIADARQ
jgi:hypothetical protein